MAYRFVDDKFGGIERPPSSWPEFVLTFMVSVPVALLGPLLVIPAIFKMLGASPESASRALRGETRDEKIKRLEKENAQLEKEAGLS